jgi:hypothetical protein
MSKRTLSQSALVFCRNSLFREQTSNKAFCVSHWRLLLLVLLLPQFGRLSLHGFMLWVTRVKRENIP